MAFFRLDWRGARLRTRTFRVVPMVFEPSLSPMIVGVVCCPLGRYVVKLP
jgi:hypothetical protein